MRDVKACIFYFLISIILLDFGNQLRILSYYNNIKAINNPVFSIVHVNNTGSAFGLFESHAVFLGILGIVAVVGLSYYVYKNISFSDKLLLCASTLFCAGVLGNLIERFRFGSVIDYINLNFINFPVFNSFDIMISLGVFLYFLSILQEHKKAA